MRAEGWYVDPFAAHEQRWFSDGRPTRLVRDGGIESHEDPPAAEFAGSVTPAPEVQPQRDPSSVTRARPSSGPGSAMSKPTFGGEIRGSDSVGATLVDVFESDARAIAALAVDLADTTDRFDAQVETARLVREIVESQVSAELTLHPLIRRYAADGDAVAESQFRTHREMEGHLRRLEATDVGSPEFRQGLAEVRDRWQHNASYLESTVYPVLRSRCAPGELRRAGGTALDAEYYGPTRPRHVALENPDVDAVVSFAEGFVDKTIDAFTHRGHSGTEEIHTRMKAGRYDGIEDTRPNPD